MGEKRVTQQTASDEIYNDDWFLKDSVLHDTTKVQPSVIKEYVNQGMATSQDLAAEVTARQNADTALGGRIDAEATARQNADSQLASGISQQMANLAEFYDSTKSYVVGDVVVYQDGKLLRCIAPTSGTFDNTKWEEVTVDDLIDEIDLSAEAISYDNLTTGLMATNVQDAIDEIDGTVDNLETAMETKAEVDGIYDDLIAGNLLSDSYTSDSAPYLYRQSPSASSVEQNFIGASVAWNQLVQNGNFADTSGWGVDGATISVSSNTLNVAFGSDNYARFFRSVNLTAYHKNLVIVSYKSDVNGVSKAITIPLTSNTTTSAQGRNITITDTSWHETSNIISVDSSSNNYIGISKAGHNAEFEIQIKNFMLIDLTQLFGTQIADHIYSLEQSTAGSGIAWLKSYGFLTKDYYAYDSGSLQSVNVSGRKIVGKNLVTLFVDGKVPSISSGALVNSVGSRSDFVKVIPNTEYVFSVGQKQGAYIFFYETNNTNSFIYYVVNSGNDSQVTGTTPSNCNYVMLRLSSNDYENSQLEFGSTATSYEPYTTHTYPTSPIDLRGLFKLSNGNLVADGDVYSADGAIKRKYGIVDLGQQTWYYKESGTSVAPYFYFDCTSLGIKYMGVFGTTAHNIRCVKYVTVERSTTNFVDKTMCADGGGNVVTQIQIKDSSFNGDATAFKTAMNGVYLIYELASQGSEMASPYQNPQLGGVTEEFIDTRDVPIPVGGERKYFTDLKAKLEELAKIPDVPSANGTYKLIATRSASGVTYSWESN